MDEVEIATRRQPQEQRAIGYRDHFVPADMRDSLTGLSRKEMVYDKEKLLKLGGVHQDKIQKWKHKAEEAKEQESFPVKV